MKICMVSYSFYEADARIIQYASALLERGDAVDVICLRRPGASVRQQLDGVNVLRIQERANNERGPISYLYRILRFLLLSSWVLTRRHFQQRYDLIHVHSVPDFMVFAALVPRLSGTPVILDIHDVLPELYASKFNIGPDSFLFKCLLLLERISVAFASQVIVANHLWCERVANRTGQAQKCFPIRNYPPPGVFHPGQRTAHGKFLMTYPGSLNRHQGVDVALSAFAKVRHQMPDAEFHIYGDGAAKPALKDLSRDLGLSRHVVFHEAVPNAEIVSVMANTDLAVEPKRSSSGFGNEALSMKILEFMSLGVPVVASRTKTHCYYYDDSLLRYYDNDDVNALAGHILELYRNPALRVRLAANALKYVESHNWNLAKQGYLRMVDSLSRRVPLTPSPRYQAPESFTN
jgi:glycosyltransferase involved in cell wall biosynthesis